MKIFIAGHRGMVGSAIRRHLLAAGQPESRLLTRSRDELDLMDQRYLGLIAEKFDGGSILLNGKKVSGWRIPKAVSRGVGYVPSERKVEGMVGGYSAAENIVLTHPGKAAFGPFVFPWKRNKIAQEWFTTLDVRPNDIALELDRFSGGNQQKVVLARELSRELRLLVASQPTRGLDVGSIEFVHEQIVATRDSGIPVLIVATELDEATQLGDRIAVMYRGKVVGVVPSSTSRSVLGQMMAGISA